MLTARLIQRITRACDDGLEPFREQFPNGCPTRQEFQEWMLNVDEWEWGQICSQVDLLQTRENYYPDWLAARLAGFREEFTLDDDIDLTHHERGPASFHWALTGLPEEYYEDAEDVREQYTAICADIIFTFLESRAERVRQALEQPQEGNE